MMINAGYYRWALKAARREWEGEEGETHEWISGATATSDDDFKTFRAFLYKWNVARTVTAEGSRPLYENCIRSRRSAWQAAMPGDETGLRSVEEFAQYAQQEWTPRKRRPTSLVSKLAFMCNPLAFAPYDQFVRRALAQRGYSVANNDYVAFMRALMHVRTELDERLSRDAATMAARSDRPITLEVAALRILDKYLMCEGGFEPEGEPGWRSRGAAGRSKRMTRPREAPQANSKKRPADENIPEFLRNVNQLPEQPKVLARAIFDFCVLLPETEKFSPDGFYCRFRTAADPGIRRGRVFLDFGLDYIIIPTQKMAAAVPHSFAKFGVAGGWYGEDKLHFRFATDLPFLEAHMKEVAKLIRAAYESAL